MSGVPNMSEWEKQFSPLRDHVDDQLLQDEPDAHSWHWGILPQDEESGKNPIKPNTGTKADN